MLCVEDLSEPQKSLSNFDIVCKDPSLTKREIADTIGISDERVLYILPNFSGWIE